MRRLTGGWGGGEKLLDNPRTVFLHLIKECVVDEVVGIFLFDIQEFLPSSLQGSGFVASSIFCSLNELVHEMEMKDAGDVRFGRLCETLTTCGTNLDVAHFGHKISMSTNGRPSRGQNLKNFSVVAAFIVKKLGQ